MGSLFQVIFMGSNGALAPRPRCICMKDDASAFIYNFVWANAAALGLHRLRGKIALP
jgi:hypothetical protein